MLKGQVLQLQVPAGSVLGQLLLNTFMTDHIIKSRRVLMKFVEVFLTLGNVVKAEEK